MTDRDPHHDPELQRALIALLEDEAPDHSQLDALLRDDDAACDEYLKMIRLHAILQREFGGRAPAARVQDSGVRVQEQTPSPMLSQAKRRGLLISTFALAAALALAITAWFVFEPESRTPVATSPRLADNIATLITAVDVVWTSNPLYPGQDLNAQTVSIESGSVEFMLASGASVRLRGRTRLTLHDPMHASLEHGTAVFDCPSSASGYAVDAPGLRVVDIGTRFMVTVNPTQPTAVHVLEGKVRLQRGSEPPMILVSGHIARASSEVRQPIVVEEAFEVDVATTNREADNFTVADDDLLETALASITLSSPADFNGERTTGEPTLRNGVWENGAYGNNPTPGAGRADAQIKAGAVATYQFDLTASPSGYDISRIDLYSNWGPGPLRDQIRVSIDYATVSDPDTFVNLVTDTVYDPPTLTQGKMSITPDAGDFLATRVARIRFTWPSPQESGAVGYSEIDVVGVPETDPKPLIKEGNQ